MLPGEHESLYMSWHLWNGGGRAPFPPFTSPGTVRLTGPSVHRVAPLAALLRTIAFVVLSSCLCSAQTAAAQQHARWTLEAGGARIADWPGNRSWPSDSLRQAARDALGTLQAHGYYFARIDSHHAEADEIRIFATTGARVPVRQLRIEGAEQLDSLALLGRLTTRAGRPLDQRELEADIADVLARYAAIGYVLAEIEVERIHVTDADAPEIDVTLRVREGRPVTLARLELPGARRTSAAFVARATQLPLGSELAGWDPEELTRHLDETTLFKAIGSPELVIDGDTLAVVRIPVEEEAPGAFDLALGYEPPGRLVGSGHVEFHNLFGGGRRLFLEMRRPPGSVSRVDMRVADPFVAGLPLQLEARFEGLQQDSTYGKRAYGAELGYKLDGGLQVFSSVQREITRPGLAGLEIIGTKQRIPVATGFFAGLGARLKRLDDRVNPRRGIAFETNWERGRKSLRGRRVRALADTTDEQSLLRQDRLSATFRAFVPVFQRQVLAVGGDAFLIHSNEYDDSDLFRFGGATTLRGYDEERFRAPFVARLLAEYRYVVDRTSYAFSFCDLGYVDASGVNDGPRGFHPGFGAGFQLGTDIGLIVFTLAANAEEPTVVRAHFELSIGL